MNRKVINCTFLVIIVSLMFENLPKLLSPGFISGPLFGKLVFFPVAFGMIYTLYYKIRQSHNIEPSINIIKYIILYIFFMVLSLFLGIDRYPYYQSIITHIKTFPLNIQLLNLHSMFQIDNIILVKLVVFTKALKNIIMDIFWNIGGCFLIYYWYKDHWQDAKLIMEKAILMSSSFLACYFTIEIVYLYGNGLAKEVIENLSYVLHTVGATEWGWPPALWHGSVRLVFDEPSFLGNYIAFLFPFLWYTYFQKKGLWVLFLIYYLSLATFLSNSRTCYGILFGSLILYTVLVLLSKKKDLIYNNIIVCIITFFAFGSYVLMGNIPKNIFDFNKSDAIVLNSSFDYSNRLDDNLFSLASTDKRSNITRYGAMKAGMRVFYDNPVLGVGRDLLSAYSVYKYNEIEKKDLEISRWIEMYNKEGPFGKNVLKNAFCEYITRLAETGVVGTFLFVFPFFLALFYLFKLYFSSYSIDSITVIVALVSTIVSGFNVSLNIVWVIWPILAFAFILLRNEMEEFKLLDAGRHVI